MKTKIERAGALHRTMTPHQMALRIVELQDALELAEETVRAKQQAVPHADLLGVLKAVVAHSAPCTINGVLCAAFPWVEYEALVTRVPK